VQQPERLMGKAPLHQRSQVGGWWQQQQQRISGFKGWS
jgi:hypothetical protein